MHIAKVSVRNIFGIQHFEFEPGKFNEIAGPNDVGKTSLLNALKSVFEGGSDATLLRQGEEKGEIVIVLDDNTTIRKRVGVGAGVTVEKDGVREQKPQAAINAFRDMLSVNPVAFIKETDPKKRNGMLLDSLNLKADLDRIRDIIGSPDFEIPDGPALEQISYAHKTIFTERTGTNRAVTEKESTINQLAQALPTGDAAAPDESEADLEEQLKVLDAAQEAEMKRIDDKLGTLKTESEQKVDAKREEIAILQSQIATLQGEISAERESFQNTTQRAEGQRSISTGRWRENRQPVVDALNLVRSNRDAVVRAQTTRETMRKLRQEADVLQEDAERQSKALKALDAYKLELLASLPIPGLVVEDGEVKRNGVPFDRLNEGQQVDIAFEIARLRAGDLGVVCIDGIESLNTAHYEAFKAKAVASGLQLFVTRVTDDADLIIKQAN